MMKSAKESLDVGVVVRDIKASLHFYQNLLGLEFIEEVSMFLGTMHRLRFGTSDFKLIDPKTIPPKGAVGLEKQLGYRYITFVITGLSDLCRELEEKGVEFTLKETELRPGLRIAMCKDPDENIVEFVERG